MWDKSSLVSERMVSDWLSAPLSQSGKQVQVRFLWTVSTVLIIHTHNKHPLCRTLCTSVVGSEFSLKDLEADFMNRVDLLCQGRSKLFECNYNHLRDSRDIT